MAAKGGCVWENERAVGQNAGSDGAFAGELCRELRFDGTKREAAGTKEGAEGIMKGKVVSVLMFLMMSFVLALIVSVIGSQIFHDGQNVDWITVLIITVGLTVLSIGRSRRTAERVEENGIRAGLKEMFRVEKK